MIARVFVITAILKASLLPLLAWPFGTVASVMLVAALVLLRWSGDSQAERPTLELRNPFELWTALQLAGFVALVMLAVRIITLNFGDRGLLFLAALSGLVDVDAITLSLAHMSNADLSLQIAAIGIAIAAGANTFMKTGIAFLSGGVRFGLYVAGANSHRRGSVGMADRIQSRLMRIV